MISMKICNIFVTVAALVISAAIMMSASSFPIEMKQAGPGPGFWPFLLGAALAVAAVVLALFTFVRRDELSREVVKLKTPANMQVYAMMALLVVFCGLIYLLGFYLATLIIVPCVMRKLECRNAKLIALTTVGITVFIYLVFGELLHTQLPESVFLQ